MHGHAEGSVDFLTRKFPLRDLDGRIYGVGGISTDVTILKSQQRQTLLSETVFMASQEAIIVTDAQSQIVRVNPAFTRQSGFSCCAPGGMIRRFTKPCGRRCNPRASGRANSATGVAMARSTGC